MAAPPSTLWRWMYVQHPGAARGADFLVSLLRRNLGAKATRSGGVCTLLWQLRMGLKGREILQSVWGCYKVLMRIGLNLHKGKVRNGVDFVLFELEVGGENGSERETKGIF